MATIGERVAEAVRAARQKKRMTQQALAEQAGLNLRSLNRIESGEAVATLDTFAKLAVILVLTSLVSAGYYMPVILSMYMRPARAPQVFYDTRLPGTARLAVVVAVLLVIALGAWPTPALHLAGDAARSLAQSAGQSVAGN